MLEVVCDPVFVFEKSDLQTWAERCTLQLYQPSLKLNKKNIRSIKHYVTHRLCGNTTSMLLRQRYDKTCKQTIGIIWANDDCSCCHNHLCKSRKNISTGKMYFESQLQKTYTETPTNSNRQRHIHPHGYPLVWQKELEQLWF